MDLMVVRIVISNCINYRCVPSPDATVDTIIAVSLINYV